MTENAYIKKLGLQEYTNIWHQMQAFTDNRTDDTADEMWSLQHSPVFTQGQAGKAEHILEPGDIPVIRTDRGGQVTYHGPGQIVIYTLFNLRRLNIGIRKLVCSLEQSVINLLADYDIVACGRRDAPGVYHDCAVH